MQEPVVADLLAALLVPGAATRGDTSSCAAPVEEVDAVRILEIVVGLAVLLMGRELYWLFVGGAGFALGANLASRFLVGPSGWVTLLIALSAGLVGALIALFLQRVAVAIAGFLAGGYLVISLLDTVGWGEALPSWALFVAGGVIGVLAIALLFEWALIVLSSLVGAALVAQAIPLRTLVQVMLFVILLAVGVSAQLRLMRRKRD
jgi:hypothetical protein